MKRESFLLLSVLFVPVFSQQSPSKVQGVTVTRTVQGSSPALRVSWSAVSGSGINYTVCYSTNGGSQSDPPPDVNCGTSGITGTSTTLGPLSKGITYYIWVRAESTDGRGPYSDRVKQNTCNVPSKPKLLGVHHTTHNQKGVGISVTWTAPESDCPITSYEVQYKNSSDTSWSTPPVTSSQSGRHDWRGLSPNTSYDARVRAVSAAGEGAWSRVGQVTTIGVPGPVGSLLATPFTMNGVPALHVRWSPPVDKAGGGLTYRLRVVPTHVTISRPTRATMYIVTGLRANTSYTVYVRAVSSGLYGPEESIVTTTVGNPGAVQSLSVTPIAVNGVPALHLRWSPPVEKAQGGLTYKLRVVPPHVTISRAVIATEYNVTGLRANTRYMVYVRAVSLEFDGPEESAVGTTGGRTPSFTVTQFTGQRLSTSSVTLRIPLSVGSQYVVFYREDGQQFTKHSTTFSSANNVVIPGLQSNTGYTMRVQASNDYGSTNSSDVDVYTLPEGLRDLFLSPLSSTSVLCSWTPPVNQRKTPLTYNVSHGQPGAVSTAETSLTLTGLQPYKEYTISVKAQNRRGSSVPVTGTVRTYSDNQTNIVDGTTVKRTLDSFVLVTWIAVKMISDDNGGSPLYIVTYMSSDGGHNGSINTTSNSVNLRGLNSGVSYVISVQVITANVMNKEYITPGPIPAGAIVGVLLAVSLMGTVAVVAIIIFLCFKKKKPPECLSGGMTAKVQGVRHSLKRKQKDEDYEMQPQPEVAYYQSLTVGSLEPIPQSSFSVHVKAMHMERDSGFEREYQSIVNDPNGSAEIAMENRPKNRYFNIHTYDHSRVVLSAPDEDGSDYINASYIDGYGKKDAYIASQGPIVETISDFWEMVWEQKSSVIVMLTKVEEKGKVKCEQYWCEELDKPYELKRNLTVTTRSHKAMADYEIRDIRVMKHDDWQSKPLDVIHMQYTGWPDYGVPTHPSSLVKFVQQVRKEYKDSTAPMVVHCSAGVGRSGTFITIDAIMERLKEKDDLNIYQFVTEMRSKRTFMVQTMDQYAFIHDALSDYLTCGDTTIPAHHLTAKIIEMSAVKEETNTTQFQDQFEFLESLSKNTCAEDDTYSKKTTIAKKNRYKDKFPYSNCHLKLHSRNSSNGGDYINASFIDSFSRSKGFIAAQAPLENTKNDVWQLIWQFKIPTVVVLCGFKEEQQVTCCRFWPDETTKSTEYDHIKVNHDSTISKTGYEVTRLDAFEKGMDTNQVSVTLFHVNNWSKSGSVDLNLVLKLMGDVEGAHSKKKKPIMVMCDDGMGRSGVFICAMSEVERVKFEGQVDVFQTIKGMRIQRPHMVDTPEHYKLCFDILLTHLDSFDTYANFKVV